MTLECEAQGHSIRPCGSFLQHQRTFSLQGQYFSAWILPQGPIVEAECWVGVTENKDFLLPAFSQGEVPDPGSLSQEANLDSSGYGSFPSGAPGAQGHSKGSFLCPDPQFQSTDSEILLGDEKYLRKIDCHRNQLHLQPNMKRTSVVTRGWKDLETQAKLEPATLQERTMPVIL